MNKETCKNEQEEFDQFSQEVKALADEELDGVAGGGVNVEGNGNFYVEIHGWERGENKEEYFSVPGPKEAIIKKYSALYAKKYPNAGECIMIIKEVNNIIPVAIVNFKA